jgi:hypothetical protein
MNNYDIGAQVDFDNMTKELGTIVDVYIKDPFLSSEGQESHGTQFNGPYKEIMFIQELGTTHQVGAEGQFELGDLRVIALSGTKLIPEAVIEYCNKFYKIMELTYVEGMSNGAILSVSAIARKIPGR